MIILRSDLQSIPASKAILTTDANLAVSILIKNDDCELFLSEQPKHTNNQKPVSKTRILMLISGLTLALATFPLVSLEYRAWLCRDYSLYIFMCISEESCSHIMIGRYTSSLGCNGVQQVRNQMALDRVLKFIGLKNEQRRINCNGQFMTEEVRERCNKEKNSK